MIIIKILAIVITAASGLLQIGLEYKWKDKRTRRHRNIRSLLIVLMIIGSITAVALLIYDDKESREQIQSLTFLKESAEKSAIDAENQINSLSVLRLNAEKAALEAEKRELKAQEDRASIQKELDEINQQIKPLVDLAIAKYPNLSVDKAIEKLSQDLKRIEDNLEDAKSIIHSFSTEITFYIEANWVNGKTPTAPGIMSIGPDPDLILYAVKKSGQTQKLELRKRSINPIFTS